MPASSSSWVTSQSPVQRLLFPTESVGEPKSSILLPSGKYSVTGAGRSPSPILVTVMETVIVSGPDNLYLLNSMETLIGLSAASATDAQSKTSTTPSASARNKRFLFILSRSVELLPPSPAGKPAGRVNMDGYRISTIFYRESSGLSRIQRTNKKQAFCALLAKNLVYNVRYKVKALCYISI